MTTSGPPAWQPWPQGPAGVPAYGRPARPATVTLAFVLLAAAAVLVLIPIISIVYDLSHFERILDEAAQRTAASTQEVDSARTAGRATDGVAIGLLVLASAVLVVPALWLRRGSPVARVLTCIAAGLTALCCCGGLAVAFAGANAGGTTELQSEIQRLTQQQTPTWVALTMLPAALVPLLAIAALVLLLLPPSNRFFRPPAPTYGGAGPYGAGPYGAGPGQYGGGPGQYGGYPYGGYYAYPAPWSRPQPQPPDQPQLPDQPTQPPDQPPPPDHPAGPPPAG